MVAVVVVEVVVGVGSGGEGGVSLALSSGMAKKTHLPHATETESTGVPAASGNTVACTNAKGRRRLD